VQANPDSSNLIMELNIHISSHFLETDRHSPHPEILHDLICKRKVYLRQKKKKNRCVNSTMLLACHLKTYRFYRDQNDRETKTKQKSTISFFSFLTHHLK